MTICFQALGYLPLQSSSSSNVTQIQNLVQFEIVAFTDERIKML